MKAVERLTSATKQKKSQSKEFIKKSKNQQ